MKSSVGLAEALVQLPEPTLRFTAMGNSSSKEFHILITHFCEYQTKRLTYIPTGKHSKMK